MWVVYSPIRILVFLEMYKRKIFIDKTYLFSFLAYRQVLSMDCPKMDKKLWILDIKKFFVIGCLSRNVDCFEKVFVL